MPDDAGVGLPSEEDLENLPRWTRVIYALRCVQRAQQLLTHFWPDAPAAHVKVVDNAVSLVRASAETPSSADETKLLEIARTAAATATAVLEIGNDHAAMVIQAATEAAQAAYGAHHGADRFVSVRACKAAGSPIAAARYAARRDYELLRAMSLSENWTDETGVDATRLGPLWPEGEPTEWPTQLADTAHDPTDRRLRFVIEVPAEANEEEVRSRIADLIVAASQRHKDLGGSGLRLGGIKVESPVPVEGC